MCWDALSRGEVDRALFDITGLAAQRLDDGHTGRIGVIVWQELAAGPGQGRR
ncbi:hypothetical protein [Streptomyces sp. NPDC048521]|uniref:hypothetical protein n=1 Tax=Streptomyces sp. NPDC048521 TaxID=3365566 RepID=UPI0037217012